MKDNINRRQNGQDQRISRRPVLKATGASILGTGLAGCIGGSDGSNNNNNNNESFGESDADLSGVTFEYWNQMNVQSRQAKSVSEDLINNFQNSTDASIEVSWDGYDNVIGADWRTSFSQGNYPVMYDSVSTWDGQFVDGDWVYPFDEYQDQFDDETISAIEWIFPILEDQYRGFDGNNLYEVPFGFLLQIPFLVRMDHFDEAGLERSRFPPEDYDDLIDIATTLQEDGPGEYGYQIHGTAFDVTDCRLPNMAVAAGGEDGLFLNDDWSDTLWDNDIWKDTVTKYVEIFTEHELSSPETPNHDDESMVQEIVSGQTSINAGDFLNHPDLMDQAGSMMETGDIQWHPQWAGDAGQMAIIQPYSLGLTRPPDGADESEWEDQQAAAIEFMKTFLAKDFQRNLFENFGLFPIRQDLWEELPEAEHQLYRTATTMAENSEFTWSAHPQTVSIQYNLPGPHLQEALNGEKSPEQACDDIAQEVRDQLL